MSFCLRSNGQFLEWRGGWGQADLFERCIPFPDLQHCAVFVFMEIWQSHLNQKVLIELHHDGDRLLAELQDHHHGPSHLGYQTLRAKQFMELSLL